MRRLIIAVPLLMLAACGIAESTPAGPSGTRSFAANDFDKVKLAGSDNVRVIAGSAFSVQASGPESVLERLEIEVKGDTLHIDRKRGWSLGWERGGGALVTVTMPEIKAASLAGSGNFQIDSVDTVAFGASLAGSGDMTIKSLRAKNVEVNLAGSGDVTMAGRADNIDISLAGSGNVAADKVETSDATISLAGSGDIGVRASGSAKISMIGSGNVTIGGTANCKTSKLGSGQVSCTP